MNATELQLGIQYSIDEIVPHAAGMSLLNELKAYNDESIVVAVAVTERTEFCVPGKGVPAWVGIEYMAQAVGAFSGIEDVQRGARPRIGLLLGTRRYRAEWDYFPVGSRLVITAHLQLRGEEDLVGFDCTIECDGKCVARGDVKAIRPHNVLELIKAQS